MVPGRCRSRVGASFLMIILGNSCGDGESVRVLGFSDERLAFPYPKNARGQTHKFVWIWSVDRVSFVRVYVCMCALVTVGNSLAPCQGSLRKNRALGNIFRLTFRMKRMAPLCWFVSWIHLGSSSSSAFPPVGTNNWGEWGIFRYDRQYHSCLERWFN